MPVRHPRMGVFRHIPLPPVGRFNAWLAETLTKAVGSMWCAYLFCGIALISLPSVLKTGDLVAIVAWVAQTFLQLVLLSVIIVGSNLLAAAAEKRDIETHDAVMAELALAKDERADLAVIVSDLHRALTATPPPAKQPPRPRTAR